MLKHVTKSWVKLVIKERTGFHRTPVKKMDERRKLKEKLNQAVTRQQKRQAQREYSEKDREVKRSCKNDKRTYANNLTRDAEEAACKGDAL